jgi:hypothetical protein
MHIGPRGCPLLLEAPKFSLNHVGHQSCLLTQPTLSVVSSGYSDKFRSFNYAKSLILSMARSLISWLMDTINDEKLKKQNLSSLTTVCLSLFPAFYDSISYRENARPQQIAVARRAAAMESPSVPMLAASRFLPPPPLLPTPSCSRRSSCVRAVPRTVETPEAHKPPRLSPRRSAVAEVNASDDPVATLTRYS